MSSLKGGKTQNPYTKPAKIVPQASPLGTRAAPSPTSDAETSPAVPQEEVREEVKDVEKEPENKEEEEEDDDEFLPNESSRDIQLIRELVEKHKEDQAYVFIGNGD
jgi:hypothetical protein